MTNDLTARRSIEYSSLDDFLDDARSLVGADEIASCGNWTLAQALMHLALHIRMSMDGMGTVKRSFVMKIIGPMIKRRIIKRGMKPGKKLPERLERLLVPKPRTKVDSAWDALQRQVGRMQECQEFKEHPVYGELTREECIKLTLRHAELHLSFHRIVA